MEIKITREILSKFMEMSGAKPYLFLVSKAEYLINPKELNAIIDSVSHAPFGLVTGLISQLTTGASIEDISPEACIENIEINEFEEAPNNFDVKQT